MFQCPTKPVLFKKKNVKRKWYLNQVLCVYNFEIAINVELRARAVKTMSQFVTENKSQSSVIQHLQLLLSVQWVPLNA